MYIMFEKKNQMAYNLLLLLNQLNKNLKERNKNYIEIILDMEKNISIFSKIMIFCMLLIFYLII